MFESGILDVAIGLGFVFLLFSLMVTAASEMLAAALKWRAAFLWEGIGQLLQSPAARDRLYNHPLIKGLTRMAPDAQDWKQGRNGPSYIPSRTFAMALIDIIRRPPQAAATATTQLKDIDTGSEPLQRLLAPLLQDSANDVDRFRENIEIWFNDGMDRVSGWYKRHTSVAQFSIALALSIVLNVDALMITRTLWREPAIRQAIVNQATSVVQTPSASLAPPEIEQRGDGPDPIALSLSTAIVDTGKVVTVYVTVPPDASGDRTLRVEPVSALIRLRPSEDGADQKALELVAKAGETRTRFFVSALDTAVDSRERIKVTLDAKVAYADVVVRPAADRRFNDVRTQISGLGLPIGWRECDPKERLAGTSYFWCSLEQGQDHYYVYWILGIISVALGWLLTAAAAALGAPFWFDLLKRFVNIRSAGKAPEERPLPPKEVSQPREPGQRPEDADLLAALRGQ